MDCLFSELTTLQYQNKAMRQELEAFRNGERYKKLQADHHKVVTGYIKEISRLLAKAHADTARVRNIWFEECDSDWEKYQKFLCMGRRLFDAHYEQFKREGAAWCEDKNEGARPVCISRDSRQLCSNPNLYRNVQEERN